MRKITLETLYRPDEELEVIVRPIDVTNGKC